MMRAVALTAGWLLGGAAVAAAAYWVLLMTPESTMWALGVSAIVTVFIVGVVSTTINAAVLAGTGRPWSAAVVRDAARNVPRHCVVLSAAIVASWSLTLGIRWVVRHAGEISAWFIVRLGWSDVRWLLSALGWIGAWLTWVVVPFVALVWLREILTAGWTPRRRLVRDALSPRRVLMASLAFVAFLWIPWIYLVPWRPAMLPVAAELPFVAVKLGTSALLMAVGAALVVRSAAGPTGR